MKKFNLFLGAAICAAGFAFFSCGEKEVWSEVEEFAPDAGTYAVKGVMESTITEETYTASGTQEMSCTLVIEGTDDSSNVIQKNVFITQKITTKYNTEEAYNSAKESYSSDDSYTFDDSTLTETYEDSDTEENSTQTFKEFFSGTIDNYTFEKSSLGNWRYTYTDTSSTSSSSYSYTLVVTMTLQ